MKTCEMCPETHCVSEKSGRIVIDTLTGKSSFTGVPIEDCNTKEAIISLERWDLLALEDAHGNSPPRLLGC